MNLLRVLTISVLIGVAATSEPQGHQKPHLLGLPFLAAAGTDVGSSAQIALGKRLFFDKRLSEDGTVSCATCHKPELAFTDGRPVAKGIHGRTGTRNAPTLLNAAFNTSEFWDGRRPTLETQALDPLINPREQGLESYRALVLKLQKDSEYPRLFQAAYSIPPADIQIEHIGRALASFERTLLAGDSPFDRYLYGNQRDALSPAGKRGLELFQGRAGCSICHIVGKDNSLFTDNDFHSVNVGLQKIAPRLAELTTRLVKARQSGTSLDQTVLNEEDLAELGRFVVTLKPADIGMFRTPTLRNVALTAPYMHDGSVATLDSAVEMELYTRGTKAGRPLILTPDEKSDLVAFLNSLSSPMEDNQSVAQ